jgi:hypothetical protein
VAELHIDVPHIARIYDYWLGGKDNFEADRKAAELAVAANPSIMPGVRANRRFLGRAVRWMAEQGVTQFLDIGTGIPSANNTHEVAQSVVPGCRVVYVDNDPIVLNHARALLTGAPGTVAYIDSDARDTARILAEAGQTLDFSQPVGVMLIAILHCIPDEDGPGALVDALVNAVTPGSFLALTHPAIDQVPEAGQRSQESLSRSLGMKVTYRTQAQVEGFFTGLSLREPGVVAVQDWHPDTDLDRHTDPTGMWGGVARKP